MKISDLRQVVAAFGTCQLKHFQELSGLEDEKETDVVLLEYQDNNPYLENCIPQIVQKPGSPKIFLFVEEVSPRLIWKALKLGARELFSLATPAEDFQEALMRIKLRHKPHSGIKAWSGLPDRIANGCRDGLKIAGFR